MHARQPAKYDIDQERVDITFNDVAGTRRRKTTRVQQGKATSGDTSRSKTEVLAHEIRQDLKFRNVE